MKKFIPTIASFILMIAIISCRGGNKETNQSEQNTQTNQTQTNEQVQILILMLMKLHILMNIFKVQKWILYLQDIKK